MTKKKHQTPKSAGHAPFELKPGNLVLIDLGKDDGRPGDFALVDPFNAANY